MTNPLTEIDERRAAVIGSPDLVRQRTISSPWICYANEARAIRQSDEAAGFKLIDTREYVAAPREDLCRFRSAMVWGASTELIQKYDDLFNSILAAQEDGTAPSPTEPDDGPYPQGADYTKEELGDPDGDPSLINTGEPK